MVLPIADNNLLGGATARSPGFDLVVSRYDCRRRCARRLSTGVSGTVSRRDSCVSCVSSVRIEFPVILQAFWSLRGVLECIGCWPSFWSPLSVAIICNLIHTTYTPMSAMNGSNESKHTFNNLWPGLSGRTLNRLSDRRELAPAATHWSPYWIDSLLFCFPVSELHEMQVLCNELCCPASYPHRVLI